MTDVQTKIVIGVDIGGTKVAAGLVDSQGQILARNVTPMVANDAASKGFASITAAVSGLLSGAGAQRSIAAIGVCAPGPLDPNTGVIINPPNVPCWRNFPLANEMRKVYSVPVTVGNDANAAALAEARWGAGRGYRNVFYTCIGTGIGTGIVMDGRIYHGRTGAAGEGGHVGIDPKGPLCNCGKRGCIEVLASGNAIASRARAKLRQNPKSLLLEMAGGELQAVSSGMVGAACAGGDGVAREVIEETLDLIVYWLANIIDLLEPDIIVIGGGVSTLLAPFLDEIRRRLKGACVNPSAQDIPLVIARYGEDAGIAGAAALCDLN
jgi:glucokinase